MLPEPTAVEKLDSDPHSGRDDALLLAASWEERCLGLPRRLGRYAANRILLTIYDGNSPKREEHIAELMPLLSKHGKVIPVHARHSDPLENVRQTIEHLKALKDGIPPKLTIDVSTYTRKHLLQLLHGLDRHGLVGNAKLYHTESGDYHTYDNEPIAKGISSIGAVETLRGHVYSSNDKALVLFLGYEGRRAQSVWEHMDPNVSFLVIPDPPYKSGWTRRTEEQNRYLLSCVSGSRVYRTHSLLPASTEIFLERLTRGETELGRVYDFLIAPLGTKAQTLGVYRFWRRHQREATIVYASPLKYLQERATFPPGRTWLVDETRTWGDIK